MFSQATYVIVYKLTHFLVLVLYLLQRRPRKIDRKGNSHALIQPYDPVIIESTILKQESGIS